MDVKTMAIQMACAELGINPATYSFRKGAALAGKQSPGAIGRALCKLGHEILCFAGDGNTAPAYHLDMLSKSATWHPQYQEASDLLVRAVRAMQTFNKQALHAGDLVAGTLSAGKGLAYGSVLAGSGLGSLYWLLSRHSRQDDADIASKQHELDYYKQLSSEITDAMNRKYQYAQQQPPQKSQGRRPYSASR